MNPIKFLMQKPLNELVEILNQEKTSIVLGHQSVNSVYTTHQNSLNKLPGGEWNLSVESLK